MLGAAALVRAAGQFVAVERVPNLDLVRDASQLLLDRRERAAEKPDPHLGNCGDACKCNNDGDERGHGYRIAEGLASRQEGCWRRGGRADRTRDFADGQDWSALETPQDGTGEPTMVATGCGPAGTT